MAEIAIPQRLIEMGRRQVDMPKEPIVFTGLADADLVLNDIERFPHMFVLGCVMDRQIKAEKAWIIPYCIGKQTNGFEFSSFSRLTLEDIEDCMTNPVRLHRFTRKASYSFHEAIKRIAACYDGDASQIWSGRPSSCEAVDRFLEFHGIGRKIASMAINVLYRQFKIPFADLHGIDVSVDVHVQRVFERLGLSASPSQIGDILEAARRISPAYPGVLDSPTWEIGRRFCHAGTPKCHECPMNDICPSVKTQAKGLGVPTWMSAH